MTPTDRAPLEPTPFSQADATVAWLFFGSGAAVSGAFALLYALHPGASPPGLLATVCAVLSACFAAGGVAARRGVLAVAVIACSWATLLVTSTVGVTLGEGVGSKPFGFMSVLVCLSAVMVGLRSSLALALGSVAVLLAVGAAQWRGMLGGAPYDTLFSALMTQVLLVLTGLTSGLVAALSLGRAMRAVSDREQRFKGLLDIAADWYWEQDSQLRFTRISDALTDDEGKVADRQIGRTRWEVPELELTPHQWAAHRADLGARRPFRDFVMRRPDVAGQAHFVSVSGEPVFDASGCFRGYWGVGRNVSASVLAQRALRAAELRYHELFARTPAPMLLHLHSVAIDANEAAARLLGYADPAQLIGVNLLTHFLDEAQRERAVERAARLSTMPNGQQLPVAEYSFRRVDGRIVDVQVTTLRVSLSDGPAVLSIYLDVTERRAAEQALAESQSLLQQVFDTSPDVITLTEPATGRYLMVNGSFLRTFGYALEEVISCTSVELGLWQNPADREQLRGQISEQGVARDLPIAFVAKSGAVVSLRVSAGLFRRGDTAYLVLVARDVSETERALAAARDAAEAASQAKSAFLANTSHEIRTPLNALLGLARLAREPGQDALRRQRYLDQILDSAEGLSAVISDILDLSKIEAGKIALESLPFALQDTVTATCHGFEALAEADGLTLSLHIADDVPRVVRGDPLRVRQILGNFLGNAIKFTARGGVRVELTRGAGDDVWLRVVDTGPGIDAATLAQLFRPFTQADSSITRRHGGTGLGLSICRELAQLMGGEVGAQSTLGQGGSFWARLPLPEADAEAVGPQHAEDLARHLAGARVLLVEDNAVNMMIAVAMLERWNVVVTQAGDGQQALDAVARAEAAGLPFDAVLMDVQMPVMSGHEAARRLRERRDAPRLPIIALTAAALVAERDPALAVGMDAFLTKPIDIDQLQRTLARAVAGRDAVPSLAGSIDGEGLRLGSGQSAAALERELQAEADEYRAAASVDPDQHPRARAQPARQQARAQAHGALHQEGQAGKHQPERQH